MFKKIIVMTFCIIGSYLAANDTQSNEIVSKMDRYQMQVVMNKDGRYLEIYLLDKEKGVIWRRTSEGKQWFHLPLPREETILLSDQKLEE